MRWNQRDLDGQWATHNRLVDDAELTAWFYGESGIREWAVNIEEIPEQWRALHLDPRPLSRR
jgi:hypothetical protein